MKKLLSLCLVILIVASFAACSKSDEKPSDTPPSDPTVSNSATSDPTVSDSATSDTASQSSAETKGKYEDAKVYENKDGKPTAKTEDGTEVELTGENMQSLYAEYEKVRGTGSEKEKELLDKMQVILEATNK